MRIGTSDSHFGDGTAQQAARHCERNDSPGEQNGNRRIGTVALLVLGVAAVLPTQAAARVIDEARLGLLDHDVPIGGDHIEEGADLNAEVLFASPALLKAILSPRPHLGLTVNTQGGTSYGYAGLTWTATLVDSLFGPADGVFASLGLGGAVHSGSDISGDAHRKGLGTRFLFHEYVELGYRITPTYSLSLFLDHISNADLGSHNPGLTNIGLRVSFRF